MRVLVTGAGGQVGSELAWRSRHPGPVVIGMSRKDLDILDAPLVDETLATYVPNLVVNAAAYTAVDRAEQERECAFAVNRDGAAHLARACFEHNVPLLHLSTDYVFEGSGMSPLEEDETPEPRSVYGQSKLAGEEAIRRLHREHVIIRTSWVFGAKGSNFLKTVFRLGRERDHLNIVDDQTGCPTWSGHVADLIFDLAIKLDRHGSLPWGTYHYCGMPEMSWHGFAETIVTQGRAIGLFKASDVRAITTGEYPGAAPRPAYSVLSCKKIDKCLGVKQPRWQEALGEVLKDLADA